MSSYFFSLQLFSYYHILPPPSNKLCPQGYLHKNQRFLEGKLLSFSFFSLYMLFFCASILMEIFID